MPFLFDVLDIYINIILLLFWFVGFLTTLGMLHKFSLLRNFVNTCERLGERPNKEIENVPDWLKKPIRRTMPYYSLSARYTLYSTMFSGVLMGFVLELRLFAGLWMLVTTFVAFITVRIGIDSHYRQKIRKTLGHAEASTRVYF